jgi:hypothetical protein
MWIYRCGVPVSDVAVVVPQNFCRVYHCSPVWAKCWGEGCLNGTRLTAVARADIMRNTVRKLDLTAGVSNTVMPVAERGFVATVARNRTWLP